MINDSTLSWRLFCFGGKVFFKFVFNSNLYGCSSPTDKFSTSLWLTCLITRFVLFSCCLMHLCDWLYHIYWHLYRRFNNQTLHLNLCCPQCRLYHQRHHSQEKQQQQYQLNLKWQVTFLGKYVTEHHSFQNNPGNPIYIWQRKRRHSMRIFYYIKR